MPKNNIKFPYFTAAIIIFACVLSFGAVSISDANHDKRNIAKEIAKCEHEIENLRRANDELSVKIAEQVNPMRLIRKASSRLVQPNLSENIVWAYENYDGGRVVRSYKKSENILSFKMPKKR